MYFLGKIIWYVLVFYRSEWRIFVINLSQSIRNKRMLKLILFVRFFPLDYGQTLTKKNRLILKKNSII